MADFSLIEKLLNESSTLYLVMIVMISVNIGVEGLKFITSIVISKSDSKSKRMLLREERRIEILEKLFLMLNNLSTFERSETEELLAEINGINSFVRLNKIYITKKKSKITSDITDYYIQVVENFNNKKFETEIDLMDKFSNEFNK